MSQKKLTLRTGLVLCPIPLAVLTFELKNCPSWRAGIIWAAGKTSWLGHLTAAGWEFTAALVLFMIAHMSQLPANIKLM